MITMTNGDIIQTNLKKCTKFLIIFAKEIDYMQNKVQCQQSMILLQLGDQHEVLLQ